MPNQHFNSAVRTAAAKTYHLLELHQSWHRGSALIITYHRVLPEIEMEKRYVQPGMYVLKDAFESHMEFLREHFEILSLAELLERWRTRRWDSCKQYCVVTFDDGWLDTYQHAYPILQQRGIPATVFLVSDFIGTRHWFWPDRLSYLLERAYGRDLTREETESLRALSGRYLGNTKLLPSSQDASNSVNDRKAINDAIEDCKDLPEEHIDRMIEEIRAILDESIPDERALLNWEEVTEMSQNGISFGSHSCTHRILTKLSFSEAKKEMVVSSHRLSEKQINYVPVFCYPNGEYNRGLQSLVKDSGYDAAVAASFGYEGQIPSDLFGLNRIGVHHDISASIPLFSFHLSGLYRRVRYPVQL